jgi:hypothetical protein
MPRIVLLLATALCPAVAWAAGVPPASLSVKAVDAQSGEPLRGAVIGATESVFITGFHSSGSECFRATASILPPGTGSLTLPAASMDASRGKIGARTIEVFAFHEGYCAARPYPAASWAGFVNSANREDPRGLWGKVETPKEGDTLTIRLTRSHDEPERRLRHLHFVSRYFSRACNATTREIIAAPMKKAILDEAHTIAATPYEKQLAEQAERAWDAPAPDPNARAIDGLTPLMRAARDMKPEEVSRQIELGGRADAVTGPDGYSALDLVLSRAARDIRETGTEGQEIHMERMVRLLASANPAPTLRAEYRQQLADPSRWTLTPHLREFWMQVREQVAGLSARPRYEAQCAIEEPALRSLPLSEPAKSR